MTEQLSESTPGDINRWCVSMQRKPRKEAAKMVKPLLKLNYNKLDKATVKNVEDALFYGATGHIRTYR